MELHENPQDQESHRPIEEQTRGLTLSFTSKDCSRLRITEKIKKVLRIKVNIF